MLRKVGKKKRGINERALLSGGVFEGVTVCLVPTLL